MKVCVIDDDTLVVSHVGAMLEGLGHAVVTATNVEQGLALVEAEGADAAVVDVLMPERDGLTFIMEVRRTRPELRIVAITGGGRLSAASLLNMASGLGADAVLVKPFSSSDLELALTGATP